VSRSADVAAAPDKSSMLVDDDIDEIIKKGEEKTATLNSKYVGLNLDDLNNFKSESMVNQWEGQDFANKVS
jgi:SWI/SNF-related matrix-associated actin-dependent regulator of chromatin subfamily A member 5